MGSSSSVPAIQTFCVCVMRPDSLIDPYPCQHFLPKTPSTLRCAACPPPGPTLRHSLRLGNIDLEQVQRLWYPFRLLLPSHFLRGVSIARSSAAEGGQGEHRLLRTGGFYQPVISQCAQREASNSVFDEANWPQSHPTLGCCYNFLHRRDSHGAG